MQLFKKIGIICLTILLSFHLCFASFLDLDGDAYEIIEDVTGKASSARVYRVLRLRDKKVLVAKIPRISQGMDVFDQTLVDDINVFHITSEAFLTAHQLQLGINHPSIVKIEKITRFRYAEFDLPMILFEPGLYSVDNLQHSTKHSLTEQKDYSEAIEWNYQFLLQIGSAIEELERRQIVHRDVKPANVLVMNEAEKRFALTDFGIATRLYTKNNSPSGSPNYAPFVQFSKGEITRPEFDEFALAQTLYFLMLGQNSREQYNYQINGKYKFSPEELAQHELDGRFAEFFIHDLSEFFMTFKERLNTSDRTKLIFIFNWMITAIQIDKNINRSKLAVLTEDGLKSPCEVRLQSLRSN